jgi:vesicle-fusing ATPase
VVDEIELLLDWTSIGPRFSNTVLSALRSLLKKPPPKNRRRLILATTSERSVLQQLNLLQYFTGQVAVPNVNTQEELVAVIRARGTSFSDGQSIQRVLAELEEVTGSKEIGVGIKHVITAINRSTDSSDPASRFVEILAEAIAERSL